MKVHIRYVRPKVNEELRSYIVLTFEPSTSFNQQLENEFRSTMHKTVGQFRGQPVIDKPVEEVIAQLREQKPAVNLGNSRSIFINYKTGNSVLSQGYTINETLNHCLAYFPTKGFQVSIDPLLKDILDLEFIHTRALLQTNESAAGIESKGLPQTQKEFDLRFEVLEAKEKGLYTEKFAEFYHLGGHGKLKSIDQLLDPSAATAKNESKRNGSALHSPFVFMPAPKPSIDKHGITRPAEPSEAASSLLQPLLEKDEVAEKQNDKGCHCSCAIL